MVGGQRAGQPNLAEITHSPVEQEEQQEEQRWPPTKVAETISFTVFLGPCIKKALVFIAFEQLWSGGNGPCDQIWRQSSTHPEANGGQRSGGNGPATKSGGNQVLTRPIRSIIEDP